MTINQAARPSSATATGTLHSPSKKHLCSSLIASVARSSGTTIEMFTFDAPCEEHSGQACGVGRGARRGARS